MALLSQLYPLQIGTTGPTGAAGQTGAVGQTGAQGNTGQTGDVGAQGNTGQTGTQGNTGETGAVGQTGAQGNTGNTGETGAVGQTGAQGNTGETGVAGQTGAQGNTGNTGFTGPTGQTGLAGDKYTTTSTTNETIGTGSKTFTVDSGLAYSIGQSVIIAFDSSNKMEGSVTSYSGTTLVVNVTSTTGSGTYNSWSVSLSGAPGPAGATGNTGVTGPTGTNGTNGAQGNTGNTGNTGETGAVGQTGAQGNTGNTGETGPTGTNGTNGAQGNTGQTGATGQTGPTQIISTFMLDFETYTTYDLNNNNPTWDTIGGMYIAVPTNVSSLANQSTSSTSLSARIIVTQEYGGLTEYRLAYYNGAGNSTIDGFITPANFYQAGTGGPNNVNMETVWTSWQAWDSANTAGGLFQLQARRTSAGQTRIKRVAVQFLF